MPDLAWDNSTRTFSCSVKSGASNFYFWSSGKKFIKTTTQSIVVDATEYEYGIQSFDVVVTNQYEDPDKSVKGV